GSQDEAAAVEPGPGRRGARLPNDVTAFRRVRAPRFLSHGVSVPRGFAAQQLPLRGGSASSASEPPPARASAPWFGLHGLWAATAVGGNELSAVRLFARGTGGCGVCGRNAGVCGCPRAPCAAHELLR